MTPPDVFEPFCSFCFSEIKGGSQGYMLSCGQFMCSGNGCSFTEPYFLRGILLRRFTDSVSCYLLILDQNIRVAGCPSVLQPKRQNTVQSRRVVQEVSMSPGHRMAYVNKSKCRCHEDAEGFGMCKSPYLSLTALYGIQRTRTSPAAGIVSHGREWWK